MVALVPCWAGGCMPSETVNPSRMDEVWQLHENPWPGARPREVTFGERELPSRWVIRQEPNLIWSTVSIVRTVDALKAGELDTSEDLEVLVSPAHARSAAQTLADARRMLEQMARFANPETPVQRKQWSQAVSEALVMAERIVRYTEKRRGPRPADRHAMDWSVAPLLQMAATYLNERSGGQLAAELGREEATQLRQVAAQLVLRLAFASAGRQLRSDVRAAVAERMSAAERPFDLQRSLRPMLLDALRQAPPAGPETALGTAIEGVLKGGPAALRVLEAFIRQWHKMDYLAVEFRQVNGEDLTGVTLKTRPGQDIRLKKLHFMQPTLLLRGGCRFLSPPGTEDRPVQVVMIEPVDDGALEIRFDGLGWALVKLLVMPVEGGAIREIRVTRGRNGPRRLTSVQMLLLNRRDRKDPRRLISFQDQRLVQPQRDVREVKPITRGSRQDVRFLTPRRAWFYRRMEGIPPLRWPGRDTSGSGGDEPEP
jgi:hypothetical protein